MSEPKKSLSAAKIIAWVSGCLFIALIVVAVPNFIKARNIKSAQPCINNLRQIDVAANQFALETGKKSGDLINFPDDLTPYIRLNQDGKIPQCPDGGIYILKRIGDIPTCSLGQAITNGNIHILYWLGRRSILQVLFPAFGIAAQVHHGDDQNFLAAHLIKQAVRKPVCAAAAGSGRQ